MTNYLLAMESGLSVIPVINKVSLFVSIEICYTSNCVQGGS